MRQDNWNIEQLRQSLDRKIAGTEERIRKGLEEAKKDYSRFFEWQADDVYKAGRLRDYYGVFRNKVNGTDDVEELQRYFKDIVRYQQERLLANPPARNSTSPMANMAHTLSLECMQRLIQDCQGFLHTLSLKEKGNERGKRAACEEKVERIKKIIKWYDRIPTLQD